MGVILDKNTRVLVQGITGKESSFWTQKMLEAGTKVVAGVTPGKGGIKVHDIPVYDTVKQATEVTSIDMSVLYVPARFAKEAAVEALLAGIKKIVVLADGVPVHDALEIKTVAQIKGATVIGPNTPGLAAMGEAMVGFIPVWLDSVYRPGSVGLISRSGTLTNEISAHIIAAGCGISTLIGCGGDSVPGTRFTDVLPLFAEDDKTRGIVMVGELGGSMEEEVAQYVMETQFKKPIVAFIGGRTAPEGKRMGHAGAIISRGQGTVKGKRKALNEAGIPVANTPREIQQLLKKALP